MQNFYTNIDLVNDLFVGTVYNSVNNQVVYKTTQYPDQNQALQDINIFLSTKITTPVTNSITQITTTPRRCCGR